MQFFRFPKNENQRKQWSSKLGRVNFVVTDHSRICSKHFTADSYDTEKFGRICLKEDAVPTLFDFSSDLIEISKQSNESPEILPQSSLPVIQRKCLFESSLGNRQLNLLLHLNEI